MTPFRNLLLRLLALPALALPALAARNLAVPFVIAVSPTGSDASDGTAAHPFQTLQRAQSAVRDHNTTADVVVQLSDGTWRLSQPLRFAAQDGGQLPGNFQPSHTVTWQAAPGAHPVLSGAIRIIHWTLLDPKQHIWSADTPKGRDTRQLWVNDHLAPIAQLELNRADFTFTRTGLLPKPSATTFPELARTLAADTRLELRATGFFTERIAPIEHLAATGILMRQPAWDNNLWGYDTVEKPYHPESAHLILANSPRLIRAPGQWAIDPAAGKLYLRPVAETGTAADPNTLDVELPQLEVLLSVAGTLDAPVHDLAFTGIRFSHTTWLGPSGPQGYASQQSGSFLTGVASAFPADPIATCAEGCPAFETVRNDWTQIPASVQVSAASLISFTSCIFAHLGQYALGIGNDSPALLAPTHLATSDITVTRSVFTDLAGGAILAGGVRREAHHPPDPRQINRQLAVTNNRIQDVSRDFRDHAAILSTYVEGAIILHNDISEVPYDAIDIGYGWAMHDPGGNPNYRTRMHGYDDPHNLVYQTPTPHHDVVVASNRIHRAKLFFHDGGAIYNLSASPHTLITENYIFENSAQIGLYLDEGSRFITVRRNVVQDPGGEWLNVNTVHSALPLRISTDNVATGNWHDGTRVGGLWTDYENNLILDDHPVLPNTPTDQWPPEARSVMRNAGIEPAAGPVAYGEAIPAPASLPTPP